MALLEAFSLQKAFGERTLFQIPHLEIQPGDRIGLVGPNGAGKSTLLHLLYGDLPPDGGRVVRRCPIALVEQLPAPGQPLPPVEDPRLLGLLGVGEGAASGGERTRLALAAALSRDTPLLLLDEPTNSLDLAGIALLRRLLGRCRGAVVLVTHDQALLEDCCTAIWELAEGGLRVFPGHYTQWLAQREQERASQQAAYDQYRGERARLEREARRLAQQAQGLRKAPRRMGNSEARLHKGSATVPQGRLARQAAVLEGRAQRLAQVDRPDSLPQVRMPLGVSSPLTSPTALRVEGLAACYGGRPVFQDLSLTLATGSRTVLLGPNGAGKSTLARCIWEQVPGVRWAPGLRIGYFAQDHQLLDPAATLLEIARAHSSLPESQVRTLLANLGFAGQSVYRPAGVLSGGERAKAAFAQLLAGDYNFLLLDEPTNHLDLYARRALEGLLAQWQGTLLVITHDRALARGVGGRALWLEGGALGEAAPEALG